LPPTHSSGGDVRDLARSSNDGGLILAKAVYPLKGDNVTDRRRPDEYSFDEHAEGVFSLLEENARLRGLVVTLSTMILKFVVDQK
jgi:hypothetical protein